MKNKVIISLSGGVVSSLFGTGVLSAFAKSDLYGRIEAIYAGSAGVIIAAYFLTRNLEPIKKIYSEDIGRNAFNAGQVPKLLFQVLWSKFIRQIPPENFAKILNVQGVIDLMTVNHPLDIELLKNQPIPLYASLVDIHSGKMDYLDVRQGDTLKNLSAAINVPPGYYEPTQIGGKYYIDGAIKEPFSIRYIRSNHPDNRIVMIANEDIHRPAYNWLKGKVEGFMAAAMLGPQVYPMFAEREKVIEADFELIKSDPNILLANLQESHVSYLTSNPEKLVEFYNLGVKKAAEAMKFIMGDK